MPEEPILAGVEQATPLLSVVSSTSEVRSALHDEPSREYAHKKWSIK